MSETKKKTVNLNITDKETEALLNLCFRLGTTPAEVLEGFICDLVDEGRSHGSDERRLASEYLERCGYGFSVTDSDDSFLRRLIYFGDLETVQGIIDDMDTFKTEIAYLAEHPEETEPGEIEELTKELEDSYNQLKDYYKWDYADRANKPEPIDAALQGVRDYLQILKNAKEGGIL